MKISDGTLIYKRWLIWFCSMFKLRYSKYYKEDVNCNGKSTWKVSVHCCSIWLFDMDKSLRTFSVDLIHKYLRRFSLGVLHVAVQKVSGPKVCKCILEDSDFISWKWSSCSPVFSLCLKWIVSITRDLHVRWEISFSCNLTAPIEYNTYVEYFIQLTAAVKCCFWSRWKIVVDLCTMLLNQASVKLTLKHTVILSLFSELLYSTFNSAET